MLIDSRHGWFRASLEDSPDGVTVTFWRRMGVGDGGFDPPRQRLDTATMDVPMHVACDRVTRIVNQLEAERTFR